jgi:pyridoxamine 5'-phosphate oxidase family protein
VPGLPGPNGAPITKEVTMSPFTDKEIDYLRAQRLGRLATVGSDGSPHIVPVGFRLDAEAQTIEIGGHGLSKSKKWRDLQANPRAAFAVDDLASVNPWNRDPWPRRTLCRRR